MNTYNHAPNTISQKLFIYRKPLYQKIITNFPIRLFVMLLPRKIRKRIFLKFEIEKQIFTSNCWNKLIYLYDKKQIVPICIKAKKKLNSSHIIWQYWHQGFNTELPDIVQLCYESVDKFKGSYTIIRLDQYSIHEYLEIPDIIQEKRNIKDFQKIAFFTDIIRLALLKHYGGIWIDSTILLTNYIPNNLLEKDYFMFQRSNQCLFKEYFLKKDQNYFCWDKNYQVNVLNSFIIAKKNNFVINTCLDLLIIYWLTQNHISHYFFFQILYNTLIKSYLKDHQCEIIDDTIPHSLQFIFNEPFDHKRIDNILKTSCIHKLTYFQNCSENLTYLFLKEYITKKAT